jgi:ATP-dependent protease HslVU (ClpYQ) peptidase subunit
LLLYLRYCALKFFSLAIGSGGSYALSAALALIDIPDMEADEIVTRSMKIASDICVYTNNKLTIEKIPSAETLPVEEVKKEEKKL